MSMLKITNLGISFGGLRAVDDFNIEIERASSTALSDPTAPEKPRFSTCSPAFISPPTAQ